LTEQPKADRQPTLEDSRDASIILKSKLQDALAGINELHHILDESLSSPTGTLTETMKPVKKDSNLRFDLHQTLQKSLELTTILTEKIADFKWKLKNRESSPREVHP